MLLLGTAFRLHGITRRSISHYDEGVYALVAHGVNFPGREFFAPPLFPELLRPVALIWPWQDTPLFLVTAMLGTLGIALAALLAAGVSRNAAFTSATLVACSGWHVVFSRSLLTDVLFTNWVLLALAATSRVTAAVMAGAAREKWRWAAVLAAALLGAWYTKYAAPVLVASVLAGSLAALVTSAASWKKVAFGTVTVLVAVALSLAGYLPWVAHVHSTVGYGNLLAHHSGYVLGWSAWLSNAREYAHYAQLLLPRLSGIGLGVVAVASALEVARNGRPLAGRLLFLLALGAGALFSGDVLWPVFGLLCGLIPATQNLLGFTTSRVTSVALFFFFVVTPLYRPYPRLAVPAVTLGCVATAMLLDGVVSARGGRKLLMGGAISAALAAASVVTVIHVFPAPPLPSQPPGTKTLEDAVNELSRAASGEKRVYVYARPCVIFYLAPHVPVQLLGNPDGVRQAMHSDAVLIVDTAMLLDNPQVAKLLAHTSQKPKRAWPYRPAIHTQLNDWHHRPPTPVRHWPYWLWLFHVPP